MKRQISIFTALILSLTLLMPIRASALGYGQGTSRDAQNRPTGAVEFQAQYGEYGVYTMSPDTERILLTFDQGYENGYTAQILDTLKEKKVSAVFFLTGDYAKREPELVKRMVAEGHVLGNHGMSHAVLPSLSPSQLEDELMSLHEYVLSNYGYEMQYFRPPCGEYDEESLSLVKGLGYQTVFWSYAYVDWNPDKQPSPDSALDGLIKAAHGGGIYLLHSVSKTNAEILGTLIDRLREEGYRV